MFLGLAACPIYFWASLQFLGVTPGGLNATGENDLKNHCDNIAAQQEKQLRPPLEYALRVLQMNEFGRVDESVRFHFVPLAQEDANGKAQLGKLKADTAAVYLNAKVLAPKEVRAALAEDASGGYHGIDPEALPEPEQSAAGQGGMGNSGSSSVENRGSAPSPAKSSALGTGQGTAPPAPQLGAVAGNDCAITGDEDGSKKKHGGTPAVVDGVSGYWVTMNGQPVFIDEEGMIRAGMGGKFNGKKLDEMTDADWKQGGEAQENVSEATASKNFGQNAEGVATQQNMPEQNGNGESPAQGVESTHTQITTLGTTVNQTRQQIVEKIDQMLDELESSGTTCRDAYGVEEKELNQILQAGLREGKEVFDALAEHLPGETGEKLRAACEMDLGELDISPAEMKELEKALMSHPLVTAMIAQDIILFGEEKRSDILLSNLRTLAAFVHLGGNLDDLLPCENYLVNPLLFTPPAQLRSAGEQAVHELGVAFGGTALGLLDVIDFFSSLARAPLNGINHLFNGDPNYFKPLADMVEPHLAQPENTIESYGRAANRFAGGTAGSIGFGGLLSQVGRIGNVGAVGISVGSKTERAGQILMARPGAQAASSTTADIAGEVVKQAGGGPVLQAAVEMACGGAPVPGGKVQAGMRSGKNVLHATSHTPQSIGKTILELKTPEEVIAFGTKMGWPVTEAGITIPKEEKTAIFATLATREERKAFSAKLGQKHEKTKVSNLDPKGQPLESILMNNESIESVCSKPEFQKMLPGQTADTKGILNFIKDCVEHPDHQKPRVLPFQKVTPEAAERIKIKTGFDLTGYEHCLQESGILHPVDKHYGKFEQKKANIGLSLEDYAMLPNVLENFTNAKFDGYYHGSPKLIYTLKDKNGVLYYVEMIQKKKSRRLIPITFNKEKAGVAITIINNKEI